MGMTVYANGYSAHTFIGRNDMFERIRIRIAEDFDSYFSLHYIRIQKAYAWVEEDYKRWYTEAVRMMDAVRFDCYTDEEKNLLLEFLLYPSDEGSVSYHTAKVIHGIIDYDHRPMDIYYPLSGYDDWDTFKTFLKECVHYHRNIRWKRI